MFEMIEVNKGINNNRFVGKHPGCAQPFVRLLGLEPKSMATRAASPSQTANLRPLSLPQRPLQLRSNSPADPRSQPSSAPSASTNVTPIPALDRQQKRYSTLPYASSNSPSPSVNATFSPPLQSPTTTLPGGLSRSSSRSGARGATSHRTSTDTSLLNGMGPRRPPSLYGSQPVTPATGHEGTPDLSFTSDPTAQDSPCEHRNPTDGQNTSGPEPNSAAVRTLAEQSVTCA